MAVNDARIARTEDRLNALTLPSDDGWIAVARQDAVKRLRQMGLPHRRDEYWRFTRPDAFNGAAPEPAKPVRYDEPGVFEAVDRLRLVFRDGVFDADASDDLSAENLEIVRLAEITGTDGHWAAGLYGALETDGQTPVARPFATLNTAAATDGVVIRATGHVSKPVAIRYEHESETSDAVLHHLVRVEEGASVTVLESGPGAARMNTVMEVDVADTGAFHHIRAQGREQDRRLITHLFGRLGEKSTLKSFTLSMNGVLTRNEAVLFFTGDNAVAHLAGAAIGDAQTEPFHHDDTVFVTHDAVNCESRQVFKKVLKNGAVGTFQGKILVKAGAQKTDGYQMSQSLLLDDDSQFLAKPELEIYADDVACSHGSTSGAIDQEGLFYLRSRGIPEDRATDLLVLAFLAEAIAEIESEDISADILARLEDWLLGQSSR